MSRKHVFEWHKRFKKGCSEMKDDSRSSKPSTSKTEVNVKQVSQLVSSDRWLTVRMIVNQLDVKRDNIWWIITKDWGMFEK